MYDQRLLISPQNWGPAFQKAVSAGPSIGSTAPFGTQFEGMLPPGPS
jgi:hypothetical protein